MHDIGQKKERGDTAASRQQRIAIALVIVAIGFIVLCWMNDWPPRRVSIVGPAIYKEAPWPMDRHDLQRTGRSEFPGPLHPVVRWTRSFKDIRNVLVGADGRVWVNGIETLTILDQNGLKLWSRRGNVFLTAAQGEPIYLYEINHYQTESIFRALDDQGKELWKRSFKGIIHYNPIKGEDGTIFVPISLRDSEYDVWCKEYVYAITPAGRQKWVWSHKHYGLTGPTSLSQGRDGTLYLTCDFPEIIAIGTEGKEKWVRENMETEIPYMYCAKSTSVMKDGTILFSGSGGFGRISQNGVVMWTDPRRMEEPAIEKDGSTIVVFVESDYDNGWNKLIRMDKNGQELWGQRFKDNFPMAPMIDGQGKIYFLTDGSLNIYNKDGRQQKNLFATENSLEQLVSGGDRTIYVTDSRGNLYAIGD